MTNPLIRKLANFGPLSAEDEKLLLDISAPVRFAEMRTDIIREGDTPANVHLVLGGFACRYKILPGGKRHIIAYLVPGDFCDQHVFILREMDHGIAALSHCRIVDIPRDRILALTERPAITRALWWATLVDEAILREWLVNIGGRPGEQRVAHLLCELLVRLEAVGLVTDGSYELPITQADLGETLSLTEVHVNRVLQRLRASGMLSLRNRNVVIKDIPKLKEFSGFNPNYLHVGRQSQTKGPAQDG